MRKSKSRESLGDWMSRMVGPATRQQHHRVIAVDDDRERPYIDRSRTPIGRRAFGIFSLGLLFHLSLGARVFGPRLASNLNLAMALVSLLLVFRRIYLFTRWDDERVYLRQFLVCLVVVLSQLFLENVLVWAVSASDMRKYDNQPALQDNVLLALLLVFDHVPGARWFMQDLKLATSLLFLIMALALFFCVVWDQIPYSGFAMASRWCFAIAYSRSIRVCCFLMTVLPSPRPGCYSTRFPPVPPDLLGWLKVGVLDLRGYGGCNDLLFSGHGAFMTLTPLMFRDYYWSAFSGVHRHRGVHRLILGLLWALVIHCCFRDVLDQQHYSIDYLVAVVVTYFVWDRVAWLCPPDKPLNFDTKNRRVPGYIIGVISVGLFFAILVVVGGNA